MDVFLVRIKPGDGGDKGDRRERGYERDGATSEDGRQHRLLANRSLAVARLLPSVDRKRPAEAGLSVLGC
jgi:hypothetical protein